MAFSYKTYTESDSVKKKKDKADSAANYTESQSVSDARNALNQHTQNKVADWNGGTYGEALNNAIANIQNRDKFSYDLNADALYNQYKNQYIQGGKLAMQDTMGQAAALTGGYGNSYASTAGNQAYQSYLNNLNDVVPELYQMALDKYNGETEDLYNQYSLLSNQYDTEYGQYRDQVSDWQTEADRLSDAYYNESNLDYSRYSDQRDYAYNDYQNELSYDYGKYSDDYSRAFNAYQQQVSEDQWAADYALSQQELAKEQDEEEASVIEEENSTAAANKLSRMYQVYGAFQRNNGNLLTSTGKTKSFESFEKYVDEALESYIENGTLTQGEALYILSTLKREGKYHDSEY